ncbi:MAG: hypothetical protein RLZZ628_1901 [Bacteroidota bacterium]|jgi:ABC-type multidrug transport system fused ATPase/permease subunit
MKKILVLLLLQFFCLQMTSFATIRVDTGSIKAHLPLKSTGSKAPLTFKQRFFTYWLQKKIRYVAQQSNRIAQKDSSGQDCVQIKLKRGSTIAAMIVSMDDKTITYKLCESLNTGEGTIRLEQVARIIDANNKMIFNNEAKLSSAVELTKGDKYASISVNALGIALIAMVLAVGAAFLAIWGSLFSSSNQAEVLFAALVLTFMIGTVVSFIAGIAALLQMAKMTPQKTLSKFSATLSTIISGAVLLLMLLPRLIGL